MVVHAGNLHVDELPGYDRLRDTGRFERHHEEVRPDAFVKQDARLFVDESHVHPFICSPHDGGVYIPVDDCSTPRFEAPSEHGECEQESTVSSLNSLLQVLSLKLHLVLQANPMTDARALRPECPVRFRKGENQIA